MENERGRNKSSKGCHVYPVEPRVIQVVTKPRSYMNHSYRDFSVVPPEMDYVDKGDDIASMSFAEKIHHMLADEEFQNCICWLPHGRAFKVKVPVGFERKICEKYFGHKRYSSFLRQLNNHGFKHITRGPDRNSYYHECMLKGMPHLCKYMPEPKDARRLIPDPENEPDFYKISELYSLPTASKVSVPPSDRPQGDRAVQSSMSISATATQDFKAARARRASSLGWSETSAPLAKRVAVQSPSSNITNESNSAVAGSREHVLALLAKQIVSNQQQASMVGENVGALPVVRPSLPAPAHLSPSNPQILAQLTATAAHNSTAALSLHQRPSVETDLKNLLQLQSAIAASQIRNAVISNQLVNQALRAQVNQTHNSDACETTIADYLRKLRQP